MPHVFWHERIGILKFLSSLFQQNRCPPPASMMRPTGPTKTSSSASNSASSDDPPKGPNGKVLPCVCAVCGDGASEHLHYGAICCFSCRAFFRRYADREKCVCVRGDSNCVIDTNRRNDCMHCRLKKCYGIGMKKVRNFNPFGGSGRFTRTDTRQ